MDKAADLAQKATDHRKTCQTCSKSRVCDKAAEINANLLEAVIFGQ